MARRGRAGHGKLFVLGERMDLFDMANAFDPCDPAVPAEARPRLSRQCQAILDRLAQGPALNTELAGIALKYTSRLSDIRKAGYGIKCTCLDARAGLYRYELERTTTIDTRAQEDVKLTDREKR